MKRVFLFLLYIISAFSLEKQSALVYDVSAIGLLNSSNFTVTNTVSSPLKGQIDPYSCYILQVNNDTLIAYGNFQYWNNTQVNGLLQFNRKTNTWSNLGGATTPPIITSSIVHAVALSDTEIVVFGPFQGLSSNPSYILNNVAKCNLVTGNCYAMGTGFPNNLVSSVSSTFYNGILYVVYYSMAMNTFQFASWQQNGWFTYFTAGTMDTEIHPSILVQDNLLYAVVNGIDIPTCAPQTSVGNVAFYDGNCWMPLIDNNHVNTSFLDISTTNGTLYAYDSDSSIYVYEYDSWYELANITSIGNCSASAPYSPIVSYDKYEIFLACYDQNFEEAFVKYNVQTEEAVEIETPYCYPGTIAFSIADETIWYLCYGNSMMTVGQYDLVSNQYSNVTQVGSTYAGNPQLETFCAFDQNIFAKGSFSYGGDVSLPSEMGIWNSTHWVPIQTQNNMYMIAACANSFLVLGTALSGENFTLELIHSDSFSSENYTSPFLYVDDNHNYQMYTINSTVFIFALAENLNVTIDIVSFNIDAQEWTFHTSFDNFLAPQYSPSVWKVQHDILYIGGYFSFSAGNFSYQNIAKYNMALNTWMPIESLQSIVVDFAFGDVGTGASVYVTGQFDQGEYVGVVGYNTSGDIVDNARGGIQGITGRMNAIFVEDEKAFYFLMLINTVQTALYRYNGSYLQGPLTNVVGLSLFNSVQNTPTASSSKASNPFKTAYIVVIACIATLALIVVAIVLIVVQKQKNKHKYMLLSTTDIESAISLRVPIQLVEDIKIIGQIGSGQFGDVFEAVMDKTTAVAVKVLKSSENVQLEKEAGILCKLNHPHIVRLYGIHKPSEEESMMVFEFMSDGTLLSLVQNKKDQITEGDLFKMLQHMLRGMQYLEENHIVHRDLALRNVLVTKDSQGKYVAKISDFGLSRITEQEYRTNDKTMPVKWTALESIEYGIYTSKSDVWSFGICMWELFSFGKLPYPGMSNSQVIQQVKTGYRMPAPEGCSEELYKVMLSCWEAEPNKRPSFVQLAEKIDAWAEIYQETMMTRVLPTIQELDVYN